MFGYVKVYQPELKMGEFEQYRGVYCALCRRLGKRYGLFAQWSLSYDFTFLALLRLSQAQECTGFHKVRCPYNPLKKRTCCCDTDQPDVAADAAVLLTYHKLRDTITDSGFFKGLGARLLLPFAAYDRRRCAKRHPDWDAAVAACMDRQRELERDKCSCVDAAAEPTAQLLEFLFTLDVSDEKQKRVLARLGYCMGRWIYLMDAADDLNDDVRSGAYNPLALAAGLTRPGDEVKDVRERALLSLNACLAECKAAYELLNIRRFDGILRNVLEWGMPAVQQQVIYPKKGEKKSHEQSL
jgi:hypothetical protein